MLLSCFCLALVVMCVTALLVSKYRRQFNYAVRIMLIGIIAIITVLIYPMYHASYDLATSVLFSLLYSLRALTGCQSVDVSHKVLIEGWLYYGYYTLLYMAFITAPIFTTGFLVSVFGNLSDVVRYRFLAGKQVHVFSHLNESAVLLAESLNSLEAHFVFCNTKLSNSDKDGELVRRARSIGAIILDSSELDLTIRKPKIRFYQISNSKDYNVNSTISLVEKYRGRPGTDIKIATFSTGVTTELLLDSIDKGGIRIKLLDEVKYACYSLLDQTPLFANAVNGKISALIVGCHYTGMEMVKAITWCGQITGCSLEINVIDRAAKEREKQFRLECPDVSLERYGIRFIAADVKSIEFEQVLDTYCTDATYVAVMTGDDKLNIDTAVYLRKYFLRHDRKHYYNKPRINLRVRDALKNKQMDALCDANIASYALHAFGSIEKTFSVKNLIGTPLERMAIGVHLAYCGALCGTQEQFRRAMDEYYSKEYNQRSSFASALHIKYKLYSCGIEGLSGDAVTPEQICAFEKKMEEPGVLEQLAILEHERWSAFIRTEGFSTAEVEDVQVYCTLEPTPVHIHYLAKMHPALKDWAELDNISTQISEAMGTDIDFQQYDYDIVRRIPDILRCLDNLSQDADW